MSFQWLEMRISEEQDRRARENAALSRLDEAFTELRQHLGNCVEAYNQAFTDSVARLETIKGEGDAPAIRVTNRDVQVEMTIDVQLPGFQIDQPSGRTSIITGVLPGGNMFYKFGEKFLSLDEFTKHVLDRTLFPKLKD